MSAMTDETDAVGNRVLAAAAAAATQVFETRLASVYAIGSLAHGGFSPAVSDVDIGFVLENQLLASDAETVETVKRSVVDLGLPLAERLSIFWASPESLRDERLGGRFPPLDRLDLLQHGRLLAGRETREGVPAPSRRELVMGTVPFALQILRKEVPQILDPALLMQRGMRHVTKRVLFPVRFLYTARTGDTGRVETAVGHYQNLDGPGSALVGEALRWRVEPPPVGAEILDLLSLHLRSLYLEFLDDRLRRMEEYGETALAAELAAWRRELGAPQPS